MSLIPDELESTFPLYAFALNPATGQIRYTDTASYIERELNSEKSAPVVNEFISKNLEVSRGLRQLENNVQSRAGLNSAIERQQPQVVGGGRMFRVKPKRAYTSKYV